jgi:hypothetical protein
MMKVRFIGILAAAFSLCSTSCTKVVAPARPSFLTKHIGETCVVQFRRDALGGAATLPVAPTTSSINGADVVQIGILRSVEGEGIVVEESAPRIGKYWIPYPVILSVRFDSKN